MAYSKGGFFSYGSKLPANLINAILALRDKRKAGQCVTSTAVMVDYESLPNGKMGGVSIGGFGVFIGGFGADPNAPAAFHRTWAKSDLIGGVYYHPRIPSVYIREEFAANMSSLDIVNVLRNLIEECGCDGVYADDPAFMLWSLFQIFG